MEDPPVTAEIQAPSAVRDILKHSCYNCHSNETDLEWFDKVAPVSWVVANDVRRARKHLNFSEIGKLPASDQRLLLFDAVNQIQLGAIIETAIKCERAVPQIWAIPPSTKISLAAGADRVINPDLERFYAARANSTTAQRI